MCKGVKYCHVWLFIEYIKRIIKYKKNDKNIKTSELGYSLSEASAKYGKYIR